MSTAPEIHNHSAHALQLLEQEKDKELSEFLNRLHPVELTAVVGAVEPEAQGALIKHVTGLDQVAELVSYGNDNIRQQTLALLDDTRVVAVVRRLEVDDAADVVATLSRRKQVATLRRVDAEQAREIRKLLAYDEETAGGIMTTVFVTFPPSITTEEAIRDLRERLHSEEIDPDVDIRYVYIVDDEQSLLGVCSLRQILTASADTRLKSIMASDVIGVHPDDDQEIVAHLIADYDFSAIPVVAPESGKLLGLITVDDVLDVIEEEHTEDLLKLAGTSEEDIVGTSILTAIRARLPWLIASWVGGVSGALLLGEFSSTLEQVVALAFFMPVVFGMAGNVGSQSSTITVRGIATGELSEMRFASRLRKEVMTGFMLGMIFGVLLGGAAYTLFNEPTLSMIVGSSIMVTMTCSASFGTLLPLLFKRAGVDPAVASGPLVTTLTDLLSIAIYFSIAAFLLGLA